MDFSWETVSILLVRINFMNQCLCICTLACENELSRKLLWGLWCNLIECTIQKSGGSMACGRIGQRGLGKEVRCVLLQDCVEWRIICGLLDKKKKISIY